MAYKALRQMSVGGSEVEPGEIITEAMDWPNIRTWIDHGFIEEVPDEEPAKKAPSPKKTAAKKPAAKTSAAKRSSTKKSTTSKKE